MAACETIHWGIADCNLLHSLKSTLSEHNGCSRLIAAPSLLSGSIAQFSAESSPESVDHASPASLSLGLLITLLGPRVEMDFCPNLMMKCTAAQAQSRGKHPQRSGGIGGNLGSLIEFDRGVNYINLTFAPFHTSFFPHVSPMVWASYRSLSHWDKCTV